MKITCIDKDIKAVLDSGYYVIPRFQRPYLWDRENIEEFWSDTIVDTEGDYFIGSIVVYKAREGKLGLVDGQQRLTTVTMILCALRNAFANHGFDDLARGIHRLIERPDIANKNQFVLQSETSYPYFQEHIQKFGAPEVEPEVGQEEVFLQAAFDFIASNINAITDAILKDPSLSEKKKRSLIHNKLGEIRDRILGIKLIFI